MNLLYTEKKIIEVFNDIGEVTFVKKTNAKYYKIRIGKLNKITVTVPSLGSWKKAVNFVKLQKDWILNHLNNNKNIPDNVDDNKDILLEEKAYSYVPNRITQLAMENNLSFSSIKISNAKTRWGSCNYKNNINISKYVMLLPPRLIDFILLHELTHTIYKNHQKEFHEKLNQMCGGKEKQYNCEIKEFVKKHIVKYD